MSGAQPRTAVIIGAGLAGCLMACYLARAGWRIAVFERRPDPRAKGYVGGRSINLALSVRGIAGLAGAELADLVVQREAIPMRGRMIHPATTGPLVFQPYSANPTDAINSVSRAGLNLTLLHAAAELPGVSFHFDHPCHDVDLEAPAAIMTDPSGAIVRAQADLILGCDGAFSPVRLRLQKTDRFDYSQSYLRHGYKELHIPPAPGGGFVMEPNALHIWPRGGAMMIALPNRDASFTCTLFWPFEGEHAFAALADRAAVEAFFRAHYADAVPLMPALTEDFARNPTSSLVTVRCAPWTHGGSVAVLGDAAHAIVPFYGQGMNCAFEDCRELAACLAHAPRDQAGALAEFERRRKPNADAIADMALENFIEMRDLAGRPDFQYRKKIEQALHKHHGDRLTPQYNLVSFSTVPYAVAQRRGREMDALLRAVAQRVPPPVSFDQAWHAAIVAAAEPLLGSITPIEPAGAVSVRP
ncbi:MAG: FAD-dependent monooxygenase [Phycisphaeraceae bacterium]|nr:FAD-dependent monooxygenase [Phycisphaeraceae bacterium]